MFYAYQFKKSAVEVVISSEALVSAPQSKWFQAVRDVTSACVVECSVALRDVCECIAGRSWPLAVTLPTLENCLVAICGILLG
jgi:hypothetical protein